MFVRFVCREPHPQVAAEIGFWAATPTRHEHLSARVMERHDRSITEAMRFLGALHKPRFNRKRRKAGWLKALFWFRAEAAMPGHGPGTMVWRAEELAAAMTLSGTEVRKIAVAHPGVILWSDDHQVLARPSCTVPHAFE